jgi:hypothetical protein
MRFLFRKEAINELIDLVHCSQEEAGRIVDAAYKLHNDSGDLDQIAEPSEFAELVADEVLDGKYDELMEAQEILESEGFILEDFGCGVGGMCGADQGIPCGGDGKAVVPVRMDGGKPKRRIYYRKRKIKKKAE